MILVLLGTNPYSFDRLACAMDELAGRHKWDVFMQTGNTTYKPVHCRHAAFIPHEQIENFLKSCDVLVTQGGAGSIHEGLAADCPVVAVPRKTELNESQDEQSELVQAMEKAGRLIAVYDIKNLYDSIQKAYSFKPKQGEPCRIPQLLDQYLKQL